MNAMAQDSTSGTMRPARGSRFLDTLVRSNSIIILIALIVASSLMSHAFLSQENIYNLLRQLAPLMLVSIGMLLVINTGGIDLSVGSIAGAGGLLIAMVLPLIPLDNAFGLLIGVVLAVTLGGLFGAVNGLLVAVSGLAPFIVTLAMMTVARGITFMMSNGQPIRLPYDLATTDLMDSFGSDGLPYLGLPWPVVLSVVVILGFYFLMSNMTFGRMIIATGSNEVAVRLAGIPVSRYKFLVYVIAGALSALAGVVVTSRVDVATPVAGTGLELDAIAACVIGGALLSGGKGTIVNTVIGVLILGLIGNIMNLLSVPTYPQQIIKGLIIVVAVLLQRFSNRTSR